MWGIELANKSNRPGIKKYFLGYGFYYLALYLLYSFLVLNFGDGLGIMGGGYLYLVVIGVTFAMAYLSWTFVEKPMLNFKKVRNIS